MTTILRHLVSRHCPKQFVSVRIPINAFNEKVVLRQHSDEIDISNRHCIVCQTPMHVAVFLEKGQLDRRNSASFEVSVMEGGRVDTSTQLELINEIKVEGTSIYLFRTVAGRCFQSNSLAQNFLLRRFDNPHKHTFPDRKIQAALYSYPRNIIIVSFRDQEYYNIFPMDFQCYHADSDIHIFGLRTTNITLNKILEERKVVVCDPSATDIKTLYFLGSHNSKVPPKLEDLPFGTMESERFKFPVPAFAKSYKEIEIFTNQLLGSHMFFAGKVVNKQQLGEKTSSLCHLHFFQFLNSDYREAN